MKNVTNKVFRFATSSHHMYCLAINIEYQVIVGISVMLLLFVGLLIAFVTGQRRKLRYHKELHSLQDEQQEALRKQNQELENKVVERTKELSKQKEELQKSLSELRATQLQLVQREKMASLGELTAGIAHEIQNPLNFVTNFAEISFDILDEIKDNLKAGNEALALDALEETKANLEKIAHHGRRASSIVKNMLEHSRTVEGEKEVTDINALTSEYLMLAYHGYRAKDKTFNATLLTQYDTEAGSITVRPQEIGRVLLNLFNNAFYSIQQKKKTQGEAFEPRLEVRTAKKENAVEIFVKDNGMGIPQAVLAKIYQPFFTTKPSGEGTGLGLSLSFDLITKGHKGNLSVESSEGEGAAFLIELPVG